VFACRVVPALSTSSTTEELRQAVDYGGSRLKKTSSDVERESNEPFVVWRRYEEFVEFSAK
jgi:hypothetical protein